MIHLFAWVFVSWFLFVWFVVYPTLSFNFLSSSERVVVHETSFDFQIVDHIIIQGIRLFQFVIINDFRNIQYLMITEGNRTWELFLQASVGWVFGQQVAQTRIPSGKGDVLVGFASWSEMKLFKMHYQYFIMSDQISFLALDEICLTNVEAVTKIGPFWAL